MEEMAGFRFFERGYGGVRLTPEGEELLPSMQKQVEAEQMTREQMGHIKGLEIGRIKLISFNSVIVCWLPDLLQGFSEKYPGIRIKLISCEDPVNGVRMIRDREADCGFLSIDHSEEIELIRLGEEPNVAVVGLEHPMAQAELFSAADLEKYPMIGYPEEDAPEVYEMAAKQGVRFNQIMTVDNDYGNLTMISKNMGFGIYPKMIADSCQFPVRGIPIENGPVTPISLGLRSYEKGSLAARAFADYVRDVKYAEGLVF